MHGFFRHAGYQAAGACVTGRNHPGFSLPVCWYARKASGLAAIRSGERPLRSITIAISHPPGYNLCYGCTQSAGRTIFAILLRVRTGNCTHRLVVRSPLFQGGSTGSNPVGCTRSFLSLHLH